MKFEEINKVLSHKNTLFTKEKGCNIAINTQRGKYVKESGNVYLLGDLKTNDLSELNDQPPIELYNLQQVGEILGMTRAGIRWHLDSEEYGVVPKPMYANETKRGNTYFWLPQQFESK